jgi:hypothetical protein
MGDGEEHRTADEAQARGDVPAVAGDGTSDLGWAGRHLRVWLQALAAVSDRAYGGGDAREGHRSPPPPAPSHRRAQARCRCFPLEPWDDDECWGCLTMIDLP